VNEEGSEAAAATASQISARSGIDLPYDFMQVDHPFLALISAHQINDEMIDLDDDVSRQHLSHREDDYGLTLSILFLTSVEDPMISSTTITAAHFTSDASKVNTATTGLLLIVTLTALAKMFV